MRAAAAVGVALLVVGVATAHWSSVAPAHGPQLASSAFVGSAACTGCHADHARSFHRTFHRTMTQEATRGVALGDFDRGRLAMGGFIAHFRTESGPRPYVVEVEQGGRVVDRWRVDRLVGSRRHQQLMALEDGVWTRLPVAWNVEEQRWFHLNEAFLTPDAPREGEAPIAPADYVRHATRWNDNCIFCHNVGPNPGLRANGAFRSTTAELGIACEACHGPGAEHVRANRDPMRRYALHHGGLAPSSPDPSIANPARMSPERSAEVCGRCHGQRVTDHVETYLAHGDPFVPGEALPTRPLWASTGHGQHAARFWSDGTPRLTAYEYQGLLQSLCTRGGLTCTTCHGMHEGDPRGQLRPSLDGDAMCTQCHDDVSGEAHAQHPETPCVDCHMPRVVYGIRSAHRTHRISIPRTATGERAMPSACELCHLESPPALVEGDPVQRAIFAAALGRPGARRTQQEGALLDVMAFDTYPAVRGIAWASLVRHHPELDFALFRATDSPAERAASTARLAQRFGVAPPIAETHAAARARASSRAIEIGE